MPEDLKLVCDRKAIELALPLLRDPKSIVRKRAFFFLRTAAGEDLSPDDPEKWEQWWVANKDGYKRRNAGPGLP